MIEVAIVGAGRIGTALQARSQAHGIASRLWRRADVPLADGASLADLPPNTPIVVCTRNDALAAVLAAVPPARRGDLVFVQNGMLRDFLRAEGLADNTRGLLFFAVATVGGPAEPGGVSPFCGPHAVRLAAWLNAIGLPASAIERAPFAAIELEKLLWNSIFGLLCQALRWPVGPIARDHREAVAALVHELLPVALLAAPEAQAALAESGGEAALVERLCGYSAAIANYEGAVKEWPWRNGWFEATAATDALPVHRAWLTRAGVRNL